MAKLKYKDKDGFWQELQVGTNVVANPMLTGTEQELTSLQVGNTKYKSGGGKLYIHSINYSIDADNLYVYVYVITSSSTPFTQFSQFKCLINYKVAIIVGPAFCGAASLISTTTDEVWIRGGGAMGSDTTTYATIDKKLSGSNFTDTVKEL